MVRGATTTLVIVVLVALAGCVGSGDVVSDATESPAESTTLDPTTVPETDISGDVTVDVVDVVDGDTVKVVMPNGSRETVRLLGVDTPEVYGENTPDEFEGVPETDAGRACLREAGYEASNFTKARLAGKTVELRYDEKAGQRGYYGRLLAYVVVDGTDFNYQLLTGGHARFYDSPLEERARYERAERDARERGVGLWACATEGSGSGVSDATADGLSVSVVADAPGNDNDNLNEEYVTLRNEGDDAVSLSGWTVTDAAGATYTFPEGTELAAGATVRLHTGRGTDSATDVYWGRSSAVWNNGGDTVTVRDATGAEILSYTYA